MTDALDRLIEAVEDGAWGNPKDAFPDHKTHMLGFKAYHGSLDAAKSLHEALLDSGFHAEIEACCTRPRVRVIRLELVFDGGEQITEARSWLLSILKAYRSQINKS